MQFQVPGANFKKDFVVATTTAEPQDGASSLSANSLQRKILTDANLNPRVTAAPDLHDRIRGKYIASGSDT